jgi:hypothetical protein
MAGARTHAWLPERDQRGLSAKAIQSFLAGYRRVLWSALARRGSEKKAEYNRQPQFDH